MAVRWRGPSGVGCGPAGGLSGGVAVKRHAPPKSSSTAAMIDSGGARKRCPSPFLLAIFLVAFAIRLGHLVAIADSPLWEMRLGDTAVYDAWAKRIAGGEWVGTEVFWYAPLYPYLLGAVYALFGDGGWAIRLLQAALGAGSAVLLAEATRRLVSERAGIFAGALLALYAPAVFYDGLLHKAGLALFLLSLVVAILAATIARGGWTAGTSLCAGVALGLLVLTRENTLVFVPVLLVSVLTLGDAGRRRRLALASLLALGLAIPLTPVALRNRIVGGEWHLAAANFGDNFYKGNNPETDGTYVSLLPWRGSPEFEREDAVAIAEAETGRALTASEVSRFWTRRALAYIRDEPLDWLRLVGRKAFLVWHRVELADTEDLDTYALASPVLRVLAPVFHLGTLVPLALLGGVATWTRRRALRPLLAMLLLYPATVVAFYVFGRYRYPVVALLVPFAAAGIANAPRFFREASLPRRVLAIAAIALALVATNLPTGTRDRMRATTEYNLGVWLARQEGRGREAIGHYEEAIRLAPDSPMALFNLGNALRRAGDLDGAEARYREAVRLAPGLDVAHNNLGRTLEAKGRLPEAIEAYRAAVEARPESWEAWSNLGLALARAGRYDAAVSAMERAIAIRPGEPALRANLQTILRAVEAGR